ncbi:MAG: GNAT family N-acetyltransferase, partial [Gaiellaceae bacterium]|nr:GNAT family N-acetyltransferase [Gaiellaceae bacterium]
MTEAFTLAPYAPSHRGDYLRLLADAWGDRALSGEELDWWFDGDPEGSVRSVVLRDGEVVGVAGHHFVRLRLEGKEVLGQLSVHAVTAPAARGRGIFRALELRHEDEGRARGS